MMRWPVARMLGWTGLPALRLRAVSMLPSALVSGAPASVLLLFVRDKVLSEGEAELIVSDNDSIPYRLSPIMLADGVRSRSSCVSIELLDTLRPRCVCFSTSLSLRRKKVAGAWPALTTEGGLALLFLPFTVRVS